MRILKLNLRTRDLPTLVARQDRLTLQAPGGSRTEPKVVTPRERREKRRRLKYVCPVCPPGHGSQVGHSTPWGRVSETVERDQVCYTHGAPPERAERKVPPQQ